MTSGGWIKLYRSALDPDSSFRGLTALQQVIAIHLFLRANHEDAIWFDAYRGIQVKIPRGSLVVSRSKIMDWFPHGDVTEQVIKTAFKRLAKLGIISLESTRHYTLVNITNYEDYQKIDPEEPVLQKDRSIDPKNSKNLTNTLTNDPANEEAGFQVPLTNDLTNSQPTPNQHLTTNKKKRRRKKNIYIHDQMFDQFWIIYPRKVAKEKALQIWERDNLDEHFEAIMEGLKAYCSSEQWTKENGKYIPHPATFLNQKRWLDEITPKKPAFTRRPQSEQRLIDAYQSGNAIIYKPNGREFVPNTFKLWNGNTKREDVTNPTGFMIPGGFAPPRDPNEFKPFSYFEVRN